MFPLQKSTNQQHIFKKISSRSVSQYFRAQSEKNNQIKQRLHFTPVFKQGKKSLTLLLTILLLASGLFGYLTLNNSKIAYGKIDSVTISGPSQLYPGKTGEYIAVANFDSGLNPSGLNWLWSLSSIENWQLSSNENRALVACINATSEPVNLELNITDTQGVLLMHTWKTIGDPYNQASINITTTPTGCIAEADGNGWFQYSYNLAQINSGTNASQIILEGLSSYGTIAIRNGTYHSNLGILPNNVALTIDKGAIGITYTPSSGNYIIDQATGNFWWNGVNDTYLLSNPYTSLITNATINAILVSSTYNWTQINNANATVNSLILSTLASITSLTVSQISDFNSTINSIIGVANFTSVQISDFNSRVNSLIGSASIQMSQINNFNDTVSSLVSVANVTWGQITDGNATVFQLITNAAITWNQVTNANLTVRELIGLYQNYGWQSSWNSTVQQILAKTAISWGQVVDANSTVAQLIDIASLKWSQILNANVTVDSLVQNYMQTATLPFSNIVNKPSGVQSYSFLIGRFANYTYYAVNGTDNMYVKGWPSSTNDASPIIQAAISEMHVVGKGGIIEFLTGDYYVNNINITGGITLRGASLGSGAALAPTMLIQNGNKSILNFNQSTPDFGFSLENIELLGNPNTYSTGSGIYVTPQGSGSFDDVVLNHVVFFGFPEYAVYTTRSWGWIVQNSIFEYNSANNSALYALYLGSSGGQSIVTLNKIQQNYGNGFYCSAAGAIITANKIAYNDGVNVYLDATHIVFSSNIVYNAQTVGVIVAGNEASISSNNIFKNGNGGLRVSGYWSMIQGNDVYENGNPQVNITGGDCVFSSNVVSYGKGTGLLVEAPGTVINSNFIYRNGNISTSQLEVKQPNCTITSNTINGGAESGFGISVFPEAGGLIAENNIYDHTATKMGLQNAIYLQADSTVICRSNIGIDLRNASNTPLFWIDGSGFIFALGEDAENGKGNSTLTWISNQTYIVNAFDVNLYLTGGGSNTTVIVNGNTIVNQTQLTTLTIPAPIGTSVTIIDAALMPKITVVPVP
jgi:hypothetical protein